jgi:hypothetical protein
LDEARDERERVRGEDELFERIGGMFSCPQAKQSFLAASVYVELGDSRAARREAELCIDLYQNGRPEDRAQGCEASAHVDLATAYLLDRDPSGAASALAPVLNVPLNRRVDWVIPRFETLRATVVSQGLQDSSEAEPLLSGIEEYIDSMSEREVGTALWG